MKSKLIALLGGALSLGLVTSASAADLAARPYTKAPPPVAAVAYYDWSGFYLGANGGWGSSRNCWDLYTAAGVFVGNEGCHDATGGVAGGQIGYRWQAATWVFGLEAQGDWADLRGNNVSLIAPAFRNDTHVSAFGLFTAQVGYAWNNALLYVKGGAAVTDNRYRSFVTATNVLAGSANDSRWGGTVGVGLEYGFAPNWSAAIEYDHLFMGSHTLNFTTPAGAFFASDRIRQDVDLVTVRLNYRFGALGTRY
jgi:outer membrane immunogenic protein